MQQHLLSILLSSFLITSATSQMQPPPQPKGEPLTASAAIERALKSTSLTTEGKPFHALLQIGDQAPYTGQVEVWWINPAKYRLSVTSPTFTRIKIVNGNQVQENDKGDYYPRWLENFVLALLDPIPSAQNFQSGFVNLFDGPTTTCLRRDDRPGNITDQMTWGILCFEGPEPRISSILTFNYGMTWKDWEGFENKQIARTYETSVLDYKPVVGRLTKLEKFDIDDDSMFAVLAATPANQRLATSFVSTLKQEGLVEQAPTIEWPTVPEGKTGGYMIVYARTDRTGQVRETSKHNSDQPRLETFGMQQALRYKFKPLIVDGVAQQMEMPLVLHFTSKLADEIPIFSAAEMKKQTVHCDTNGGIPAGTPKGTVITIRISVNETGKTTGMAPTGKGNGLLWMAAMAKLRSCTFAPYVLNGKPTEYKGDVELTAR